MRTIPINSFKKYVEFLSAKDMSGGTLPPDDFNNALPFVVGKMVRKYFGVPEQYQVGVSESPINYEVSQVITDYIGHLKEDKMIPVGSDGRMITPVDYLHKSSISASFVEVLTPEEIKQGCCDTDQTTYVKSKKNNLRIKWVPVTVLTDNEWSSWTDSSLRYPDKEFPIARRFKNYWEFLPLNISTVRFIYLRYPQTPVWNYTIVNLMPVYNPIGSVDIELPEICCDEMAATLLSRLGITIREEGLTNWANYVKQSGV